VLECIFFVWCTHTMRTTGSIYKLVKYLFTSYTAINIKIHTIKCYKF